MKKVVPALAIALMAGIGGSSAAQAAVHTIDFSVGIEPTGGGTLGFMPAGMSTLDKSAEFDFDGTTLVVDSVGADDNSSGVAPGDVISLVPNFIKYGMGSGGTPILNSPITKSWTASDGDVFTEILTDVASIDRGSTNDITVKLTGTVSDVMGIFAGTPASMTLAATEDGGPGAAISVSLTNFATTTSRVGMPGTPEPSTWVMMTLGFIGLGYAAVRRSSKDRGAPAM
jgi:PEP-CTERM motif